MGQEVSTSRFSKQDFKTFEKFLREETQLLARWFEGGNFVDEHPKGGFELEAWLIDGHHRPAPINEDFLRACNNDLVVPELAKFNIEMNGSPQVLNGNAISRMQSELELTWTRCSEVAGRMDAGLAMIGTLPTVEDHDLVLGNMSALERFRALNEQVLRLRKGQPLTLNIQGNQHLRTAHYDVMLESAATSFQIHVQVGAAEATRFFNTALIVSAPIVAVCANSPFLFGRDLWDETRIPLFEQSVASQSDQEGPCGPLGRVSFGRDFLHTSLLECYQENVACYPVLLPACMEEDPERLAHLRLHNGTIWRWNRPLIGFDNRGCPHLRIEHRVIPAGPTIVDSFANSAFFYGLLYHYGTQETAPESSLQFGQAKENFYTAARLGLRAKITWLDGVNVRIPTLVEDELLPKARLGLERLGIDHSEIDYYLGIIAARTGLGRNGTGWQRAFVERHGADMSALTAAYLEQQRRGHPVHEWPIV